MNIRIKVLAIILIFIFRFLPVYASDCASLPDNSYFIIDVIVADVTGDMIDDTITLYGQRLSVDDRHFRNPIIIVENGSDHSFIRYSLDNTGGLDANLFAGDFSGDKIADIYIKTITGGSGGWSYHHIISFNGKTPQELFGHKDNCPQGIIGLFVNNFQVELSHPNIPRTIFISINDKRDDYTRIGVYDQTGVLKKDPGIMIAPFNELEPVYNHQKEMYELNGTQQISGAYRAHYLAILETRLSYTEKVWLNVNTYLSVNCK